MSFNANHTINTGNYEEWFILYLDNELNAQEKAAVEQFVGLHPHLKEELDLLMDTKLPAENLVYAAKQDLQSASMKQIEVDASLLFYIDNELPAAERKALEAKLATDKNLQQELALLQRAKADPAEVVAYPNKKELYRHHEWVVAIFPIWMRVAVAVIILLMAVFFAVNNGSKPAAPGNGYAIKAPTISEPEKQQAPLKRFPETLLPQELQGLAVAKSRTGKEQQKSTKQLVAPQAKQLPNEPFIVQETKTAAIQKVEAIKIDLAKQADPTVIGLNNVVANLSVTSLSTASYNQSEAPEEPIVTDGDDKQKRTPAKGFLRKVSRFIERRTGIGTVNADNELLVGAVALKLN